MHTGSSNVLNVLLLWFPTASMEGALGIAAGADAITLKYSLKRLIHAVNGSARYIALMRIPRLSVAFAGE